MNLQVHNRNVYFKSNSFKGKEDKVNSGQCQQVNVPDEFRYHVQLKKSVVDSAINLLLNIQDGYFLGESKLLRDGSIRWCDETSADPYDPYHIKIEAPDPDKPNKKTRILINVTDNTASVSGCKRLNNAEANALVMETVAKVKQRGLSACEIKSTGSRYGSQDRRLSY